MANSLRQRFQAVKEDLHEKRRPAGWVLPREPTSFAEEGTWYAIPSLNLGLGSFVVLT